jgi:hypothetical protein
MAGGWRVSDDQELAALRRARRDARQQRTEDAWNRLAEVVERCDRLGLFDGELGADDAASTA